MKVDENVNMVTLVVAMASECDVNTMHCNIFKQSLISIFGSYLSIIMFMLLFLDIFVGGGTWSHSVEQQDTHNYY